VLTPVALPLVQQELDEDELEPEALSLMLPANPVAAYQGRNFDMVARSWQCFPAKIKKSFVPNPTKSASEEL
jgi:hypothetical protein